MNFISSAGLALISSSFKASYQNKKDAARFVYELSRQCLEDPVSTTTIRLARLGDFSVVTVTNGSSDGTPIPTLYKE